MFTSILFAFSAPFVKAPCFCRLFIKIKYKQMKNTHWAATSWGAKSLESPECLQNFLKWISEARWSCEHVQNIWWDNLCLKGHNGVGASNTPELYHGMSTTFLHSSRAGFWQLHDSSIWTQNIADKCSGLKAFFFFFFKIKASRFKLDLFICEFIIMYSNI